MESVSCVLSLIPEMIPTTEQAFDLGFTSGSLYLASFSISNHGKDFQTMNTSDLKIKCRISHYTYIPLLILRPQAYVSPHFTFLSPLYQLHHRLHISAQMPFYRENLAKYPMEAPHPTTTITLYTFSLLFFFGSTFYYLKYTHTHIYIYFCLLIIWFTTKMYFLWRQEYLEYCVIYFLSPSRLCPPYGK